MTDTDTDAAQFDPTAHVTEHKDIEWDEEFQPYERRLFRWDLIADQLRQRPGKWARVTGAQGRNIAQKHLDERGPSCPAQLREGRWQVTTRRAGLCSTSYSATRRTIIEAQPGLIDAAAERLRALQPEAARLAREAIAKGRVTPAGKAARADAVREVVRTSTTRKTCPVCGSPMPTGAKHRKLRVCSDECESTTKRAGAHRRAARDAGEPLDFQRRDGTGRQLSFDDIAALLKRSPEAIRARLRVGTLPPHDGRRDGARWWWESSITPPRTHETGFGGTGA